MKIKDAFTQLLSRTASSVAVVTSDRCGELAGVTVTSFCSVSIDPPSILVCINKRSAMNKLLKTNKFFCFNLLNESQAYEAKLFAGEINTSVGGRHEYTKWLANHNGTPYLVDSLASFHCEMMELVESATHSVFIAQVKHITSSDPYIKSLVYCNRKYNG